MAKLTGTAIYWEGPGWYVRLVIYLENNEERHKYTYVAPVDTGVAEMQDKIKEYERPPDYLTPTVKRWRNRPPENEKQRVHDGPQA